VPPSLRLGSTRLGPLDSQGGGSFILQNVGTIYLLTLHNIPEDMSLYHYCCENLRSHKSKVHPCTGRTAHRGSRGVALLYRH
jgi:hypothetical protein